jgi:hypothetical protein
LSKGNAFFCQYTGKPLNIIYHLHNRVQLFWFDIPWDLHWYSVCS